MSDLKSSILELRNEGKSVNEIGESLPRFPINEKYNQK